MAGNRKFIMKGAENSATSMGQRVGVMAAVLAVLLAIVTIASHRTHTEAIIARSEANDKWQQYQSTRDKFHSLELGELIRNPGTGQRREKAQRL